MRHHLELIESSYQANDETSKAIVESLEKIKEIIPNRCLKHLNRELRRLGLNVGNKCLYWVCKIGMRRSDWVSQRKVWQSTCVMCLNKNHQENKSKLLRAEFEKNPNWSSAKIKELARKLNLKVT